jgi:hypothetical protein
MGKWTNIKHFSPKENWGNPKLISPLLLEVLDAYRDELGIPLHVSNALRYPSELGPKVSAHYVGKDGFCLGVDVIPLIPGNKQTLLDCFLLACRYPFNGIGIYPYWRLSKLGEAGSSVYVGGLHLDVASEIRKLPVLRAAAHWVGIPGEKYKPKYYGATQWNFERFGIT